MKTNIIMILFISATVCSVFVVGCLNNQKQVEYHPTPSPSYSSFSDDFDKRAKVRQDELNAKVQENQEMLDAQIRSNRLEDAKFKHDMKVLEIIEREYLGKK